MKKRDRLAAAVFFLIAALAALKAVAIGFGTFTEPGPGFFPFWLAAAMALAAAACFLTGAAGPAAPLWGPGSLRRPLVAVAVIAGFIAALEFLGFCSATLLLFIAWLRLVEGEGWTRAGVVAVVGTACAWGLFAILLGLSLPRGLLI